MSLRPAEWEALGVVVGAALAALLAGRAGRLAPRPQPSAARARAWVLAAAALAALTHAGLALLKLDAYAMGAEDLGRVDQAIWSVLRGRPLEFSAPEVGRAMSRMAGHVELLYLPLAPLFLLWDHAGVLLVAQALAVALGAIPAWRLGRVIGGERLGVAAALAYLAHPAVGYAVLSDVHGDTLALPALLWALERGWSGHRRSALAAMALAIAGKEYVAALAVTSGILIAVLRRERRLGAAWAAMGLAWLLVVVPALHRRYRPDDFPDLTPLYYQKLGRTPAEVVKNSLLHPQVVLGEMASLRKLGMTALLLAPLGFAPVLRPGVLLAAAPVFVPLAVSEQLDIHNHHNATLVPFLLLAGLLGARRLAGERAWAFVLAGSAVVHLTIAPTPFSLRSWSPGRFEYLRNAHVAGRTPHHAVLDEMVALVPRAARVSASGHIVPRLSHREVCFAFPAPREDAKIDVAIVDLAGSTPPHWRTRASEIARLRELLGAPGFRLVVARDGVFLLARDGLLAPAAAPACAVEAAPLPWSIGPLRLERDTRGEPVWTALETIPGPLLLREEGSRELRLPPSIGPFPWPAGESRGAGDCLPPSGSGLELFELREGQPLAESAAPPAPWLSDPARGYREVP